MEMMTTKAGTTHTLLCRLRLHEITRDGDFIPAGTPVKVLGWAVAQEDAGKIEVRVEAYVYAGDFAQRELADDERDVPAVGVGLCIGVVPGNLVFDQCRKDRTIG